MPSPKIHEQLLCAQYYYLKDIVDQAIEILTPV